MSKVQKIGPYDVIRTVGRGSFGVVKAVKDEKGNVFVVKQLDMSCMNSKEKMNVVNEIRTLIQVSVHPFIVRYKEAFLEDNMLYVAMDYCSEGDLSKYIKKYKEMNTRIPESTIRRWLLQIITGLKFIHDKNFIHRDLKCNNIFLDEHERAKIGDFGLSRILEQSKEANTLCGTISYMAPEVCKNMPYSFPADIWSLGVILYELISLESPFKSENSNMLSVVHNICETEPVLLPGDYTKELTDLCYWMLKKNWEERPTAYDLIATDYMQEELQLLKKEILNNNVIN